jgi:hypothetical protein
VNREEFNNLVWLIAQVAEIPEFEIIGSNAIHGHLPPEKITGPLAVSADLDALLDRIRNWASVLQSLGPLSTYAKEKRVWVDIVSEHTVRYPASWRERQIPIRLPIEPSPVVWCPDLTDIAAAKMGAFRSQDKAFVSELLRIGELDPDLLIERIRVVERVDRATLDKAVEWVEKQRIDLERDART